MTTATDKDTLDILKELESRGIVPGEELERVIQKTGGEVVSAGGEEGVDDEGNPIVVSPAVMVATTGAGYTTVYHMETGLDSQCSNNMLPAQLRKKLPNGKRAFTINAPGTVGGPTTTPTEGTLVCYMNPAHEMYSVCQEFGFTDCVKSNIASPYEVIQHMRHRHKQEWDALENRREQADRDENREIQRGMLRAVQGRPVEVEPETEPPTVDIPQVLQSETILPPEVESPPIKDERPIDGACAQCDFVSQARKKATRKSSLATHIKGLHAA